VMRQLLTQTKASKRLATGHPKNSLPNHCSPQNTTINRKTQYSETTIRKTWTIRNRIPLGLLPRLQGRLQQIQLLLSQGNSTSQGIRQRS
jgi:hypothetical protein